MGVKVVGCAEQGQVCACVSGATHLLSTQCVVWCGVVMWCGLCSAGPPCNKGTQRPWHSSWTKTLTCVGEQGKGVTAAWPWVATSQGCLPSVPGLTEELCLLPASVWGEWRHRGLPAGMDTPMATAAVCVCVC